VKSKAGLSQTKSLWRENFKRGSLLEKWNSLRICFRDGLLETGGRATEYFNAVTNYSKTSTYLYTEYDREKRFSLRELDWTGSMAV